MPNPAERVRAEVHRLVGKRGALHSMCVQVDEEQAPLRGRPQVGTPQGAESGASLPAMHHDRPALAQDVPRRVG